MNKKYTIEVPIYSSPIEFLSKLNRLDGINIVMYGGVPDSPLNGGRFNYGLYGFQPWNRFFFRLTKKQLEVAKVVFYETIAAANQNNIPFLLAYTNMFVNKDELNDDNLYPVKLLVEYSNKYNIKNGLILNNKFLESFIREKYEDKLLYVSSCTKYVSPYKVLAPDETLNMYLADSSKYDFICLTPQDSRRGNLIKGLLESSKGRFIAICNSYCADNCNCYFHYKFMSEENKKSLIQSSDINILAGALAFILPRAFKCPAFRLPFCKVDIEKIVEMQVKAGVVNFKLGRGFGEEFAGKLVGLIKGFSEK